MPCEVGELLPQSPRRYPFKAVDEPRDSYRRREVHQQVHVVRLAVELGQFAPEVRGYVAHDLLHPGQMRGGEHGMPVLGDENQVDVQDENTVSAGAYSAIAGHETKYTERVRLRYNYRLYPSPGQRAALARAFGCARVVFNDGLHTRQEADAAGLPYISDAELPARLTTAKATPERAWLGGVSAVVGQQSLADLNTA
jgi:putative transposase